MSFNKIKLIAYDFDGVMTDNHAYMDQDGREMVKVNRADGLGIFMIQKLGIDQIIISTEKNPVVSKRAKKLKIDCLQGINNKMETLNNYCKDNNYKLNNVGYVGNDINDLDVMKISGYSFCPADAHDSIKAIVNHVFCKNGGHGVVRELLDLIRNKQGE